MKMNIIINFYEKLKNNISFRYITIFCFILLIVIFNVFFLNGDQSREETLLIKDLYGFLNVWDNQADFWYSVHLTLSFGSILASLTLTAYPIKFRSEGSVKGLAFVAALSTGLITAFEPGNMSNAYREGWRELNVALLACKADSNTQDRCNNDLVIAYAKGEKLIGRNYIAPSTKDNNNKKVVVK